MKWIVYVVSVALFCWTVSVYGQEPPTCAEIEAALAECSDQIAENDALIETTNALMQQEIAQLLALFGLKNGGANVDVEIANVIAEIGRLDAELVTLHLIHDAQVAGWGLLWAVWFSADCEC